jgi:hypothetical protein
MFENKPVTWLYALQAAVGIQAGQGKEGLGFPMKSVLGS